MHAYDGFRQRSCQLSNEASGFFPASHAFACLQGPQKKFPVMTGFDLLSKTAHAYEARKSDLQGSWKEQACMAEREAARSEPAPE